MRSRFWIIAIVSILCTALVGWIWKPGFLLYILIIPLILLGIYDVIQSRHSLKRNFPLLGRTRYILEWFRPKIYQYFVEPDYDGRPFNRIFRSIIYSRAKKELSTAPFGTQFEVYEEGYEWMHHSIAAKDPHELNSDPRVDIGNGEQAYSASLFNVSAMSFGSLSKHAILALNGGAQLGGFAHNTGEGGISPYHLEPGGDLIYQIGTGYFGCRTVEGNFDPVAFQNLVSDPRIKMIELKLSQGAKPGHGGILPAKKVTEEIAKIRRIPAHQDVISPPYHRAFRTPRELVRFINQLRQLANGKPVGFKLCIGHQAEFISICKAMVVENMYPDFIAIDGGEGGTGAAPLEFSNSVGMPFKDGLAFAYNALQGFGIKEKIKLIGAGKIATGYHIFRALALGADATYSARAMMMAVGCIQALECNKNTCPVGVATQKEHLVKGLVVADKKYRVANYHKETIKSFVELLAASGLNHPDQINRGHIYRRISHSEAKRYDQLYPYVQKGALLHSETIPDPYKEMMQLSDPDQFMLHQPLTHLHV